MSAQATHPTFPAGTRLYLTDDQGNRLELNVTRPGWFIPRDLAPEDPDTVPDPGIVPDGVEFTVEGFMDRLEEHLDTQTVVSITAHLPVLPAPAPHTSAPGVSAPAPGVSAPVPGITAAFPTPDFLERFSGIDYFPEDTIIGFHTTDPDQDTDMDRDPDTAVGVGDVVLTARFTDGRVELTNSTGRTHTVDTGQFWTVLPGYLNARAPHSQGTTEVTQPALDGAHAERLYDTDTALAQLDRGHTVTEFTTGTTLTWNNGPTTRTAFTRSDGGFDVRTHTTSGVAPVEVLSRAELRDQLTGTAPAPRPRPAPEPGSWPGPRRSLSGCRYHRTGTRSPPANMPCWIPRHSSWATPPTGHEPARSWPNTWTRTRTTTFPCSPNPLRSPAPTPPPRTHTPHRSRPPCEPGCSCNKK